MTSKTARLDAQSVLVYIGIASVLLWIVANDTRIPFLETEWFHSWWWVCLPLVLVYGIALHLGQQHMRAQAEPCNTKQMLAYWNFGLAFFSMLGLYRNGGEFVAKLASKGLRATYCENDYYLDRSVYFWYFFFVISKLLEFGDTAFLVLSKKPVPFIHWFHHMLTMVYSFYIAVHLPAIGRWMSSMNFFVHTLMYAYYWLMANGVKVPKPLAKTITVLQIVQMFVGLSVDGLAMWWKYSPAPGTATCRNGGYTTEVGTVMYLFYVYLFLKFFVNAYLRPKSRVKTN